MPARSIGQIWQSGKIFIVGLLISLLASLLIFLAGVVYVEGSLGHTMPLFTSEGVLMLAASTFICVTGVITSLGLAILFPCVDSPRCQTSSSSPPP